MHSEAVREQGVFKCFVDVFCICSSAAIEQLDMLQDRNFKNVFRDLLGQFALHFVRLLLEVCKDHRYCTGEQQDVCLRHLG